MNAEPAPPPLVLASASAARTRLLSAAEVPHTVDAPTVDESGVKASVLAAGGDATEAATALAELKAMQVVRRHGGALVVGADQILECGGRWYDKPVDREAARAALKSLRGRTHELAVAAVAVRSGGPVWRHATRARLAMRPFGDDFLEYYLDLVGARATESVGAYQIEGPGVQLFSRVDGDFFAILGLPLLPLLDFLRGQGVIPR